MIRANKIWSHSVKLLVLLVLLACIPCSAADQFVDPCYQVRGRLSVWNGTPTLRIWVVGTQRILGIPSEETDFPLKYSKLPANVERLLIGNGTNIFADFDVCPLTKERPGTMRMVFVRSASHVVDRSDPSN